MGIKKPVIAKLFIITITSSSVSSGEDEKQGSIIRDILHAFPKLMPLVLSHHPDCTPYSKDVIRLGRVRLCRGCTIAYGIAGILVLIYLLVPQFRSIFGDIDPFIIIGVGAFLGTFQVLRAFHRKMGIFMKSVVKTALGSGIALILIGIFQFELGFQGTFWTIFLLFLCYGVVGLVLRWFYMKKTCDECDFHSDWQTCDGMKVINELD